MPYRMSSRSLWQFVAGLAVVAPAVAPFVRAQSASLPSVPSNLEQSNSSAPKKGGALPSTLTTVPEDFSSARLAPGFLLQMDIYNVPEMSTALRVDQDGNVIVPLVGAVHVADETIPQAQSDIAKALVSHEILVAPQITLNVVQLSADNVTVLGEVQIPGRIQLLAPKSLQDVLALAGGETLAAGNDIEVQRRASGESIHVSYAQGSSPDVLNGTMINPGDRVFVRRAGIIYVLGAVNKAGGYLMVNGGSLNVVQAVALAGGTTLQATTKTVKLVRPVGTGSTEIDVRLDAMSRGKEPPITLQPNDILYIPTNALKAILINGSSIIGTATSATIYRVP